MFSDAAKKPCFGLGLRQFCCSESNSQRKNRGLRFGRCLISLVPHILSSVHWSPLPRDLVGEQSYLLTPSMKWRISVNGNLGSLPCWSVLSVIRGIAIAVKLRTSMRGKLIPDHLGTDKLVRCIHRGFDGTEYQAAKAFFDFYRIQMPVFPPSFSRVSEPTVFFAAYAKALQ